MKGYLVQEWKGEKKKTKGDYGISVDVSDTHGPSGEIISF